MCITPANKRFDANPVMAPKTNTACKTFARERKQKRKQKWEKHRQVRKEFNISGQARHLLATLYYEEARGDKKTKGKKCEKTTKRMSEAKRKREILTWRPNCWGFQCKGKKAVKRRTDSDQEGKVRKGKKAKNTQTLYTKGHIFQPLQLYQH